MRWRLSTSRPIPSSASVAALSASGSLDGHRALLVWIRCGRYESDALRRALETGERVVTTGFVLQELLQGFAGPRARDQVVDRFSALPLLTPDREDHIAAASLLTFCRKRSVQVGTIDALLSQRCLRHDLTLLTTDLDFQHVAKHFPLRVWKA